MRSAGHMKGLSNVRTRKLTFREIGRLEQPRPEIPTRLRLPRLKFIIVDTTFPRFYSRHSCFAEQLEAAEGKSALQTAF